MSVSGFCRSHTREREMATMLPSMALLFKNSTFLCVPHVHARPRTSSNKHGGSKVGQPAPRHAKAHCCEVRLRSPAWVDSSKLMLISFTSKLLIGQADFLQGHDNGETARSPAGYRGALVFQKPPVLQDRGKRRAGVIEGQHHEPHCRRVPASHSLQKRQGLVHRQRASSRLTPSFHAARKRFGHKLQSSTRMVSLKVSVTQKDCDPTCICWRDTLMVRASPASPRCGRERTLATSRVRTGAAPLGSPPPPPCPS